MPFTPPEFIVTDGGLAAASVASPVGPFVHIEGFRVGSAFGYTPLRTDTDLTGDLLYSGVPSTYRYVGDNTINVICKLPADAGPFEFGEVCVDLAGGVMFAKAAFPSPQLKYSSLGTNVLSSYTFNCLLKLSQPVAIFKIDTLMGEPPSIWEVDLWSDVYPPALSANPTIPAILVRELDEHGNSTLIHQASAAHWTVGTNYELMYSGNARVLNGSGVVIDHSALTAAIPYTPIAAYTTSEQRAYVVETADGYLRSVSFSEVNPSIADTQSFYFNEPMPGSLSGAVSIYTNRKSVMTGARLSQDANNLIELRADGLYYGTEAPDSIKSIYIDAINGNDSNIGSRASPVKTIRAATSRGGSGIDRFLFLHELQQHVVDPALPAIMRGGSWIILPYGPGVDSLPPVPGNNSNMQEAAIQYAPTILGLDYYNAPPDASGTVYQIGSAFYPSDARVEIYNTHFVCGSPNGSGNLLASNRGTFQSFADMGSWVLNNCSVDTANGMFSYVTSDSFTIALNAVRLEGNGYIALAGSKLLNIDNRGGNIGVNAATPAQIIAKILNAEIASLVYTNMTTNITPPGGTGGMLERITVPNPRNYTVPLDRKGYYSTVRQEESNVLKGFLIVNGTQLCSIDVKDDGNSGMYTIPVNPGDNIQITGEVGVIGVNTISYVWLYPVGSSTWS